MAQLAGKGTLKVGDDFVHESIIGSLFDGRVEAPARVGNHAAIVPLDRRLGAPARPSTRSIVDDRDPLAHGFQLT